LVSTDLDPEDDQDVRNEALIMRSLDHSNVVKLLDFIEAEKFFYLIIGTVPFI
jgi:serine/threonine protein kinase